MHHSLLSVNQVRSYDVPLWDNPCDPYHRLSIEAGNSVFEMEAEGIVIFIDTRSPTADELNSLPQIEITSSACWRPDQATYKLHPVGVEYLEKERAFDAAR